MKTENTPENKAKFFAQYWGQNIMTVDGSETTIPVWFTNNRTLYLMLQLRPLSSITDDEAIEVAKIHDSNTEWLIKENCPGCYILTDRGNLTLWIWKEQSEPVIECEDFTGHCTAYNILAVYQYLQSKGFALPYHDLSVDDLIAYGWIKLTK